ncbi:MAG: restriction endonuclease subunit S [Magnetococcus sp. YQC-5]
MNWPQDWNEFTLGDVAQYLNGKAFKPSDWGTAGLPIIRIQNLTDPNKPCNYFAGRIEDRYRISNGDLLISWSATLGSFIWDGGDAVLNQHIFKVVPNLRLADKEFLHYLVLNILDEMAKHTHGLAMKHITKKKFEALVIKLPSLDEQRRIVTRIKECMERVEEIEALRAGAIEEAFFLGSAVFADHVESLNHSDFGSTVLGDAVEECKYGTSIKANTSGTGFPILRMGNIQNGRLDVSDLKHIDLPENEAERYVLQHGDILINRTNSLELVGKSAVFYGLEGQWVYASYLVRLRIDRSKAIPEYVNAVINSRIGRNYVYRTARRAIGMVNINAQEIQRMPLPLPSLQEQEKLVQQMAEVEPIVDELKRSFSSDGIEHLRESILRKAFAGEL